MTDATLGRPGLYEHEEIVPRNPDGSLTPEGLAQLSRLCARVESLSCAIANLQECLGQAEFKLMVAADWRNQDAPERLIVPCLTPLVDSYLIEPKPAPGRYSPRVTRTSKLSAATREPEPAPDAEPVEHEDSPPIPLLRRLFPL